MEGILPGEPLDEPVFDAEPFKHDWEADIASTNASNKDDMEPLRKKRLDALDLSGLEPGEILALHREAYSYLPEEPLSERPPDDPDEAIAKFELFTMADEYADAFERGLANLFATKPHIAAATFELFATNLADDEARSTAAWKLRELIATNHDAGLRLTARLIADPVAGIREAASGAVEWALEDGSISVTEAIELLRIYDAHGGDGS